MTEEKPAPLHPHDQAQGTAALEQRRLQPPDGRQEPRGQPQAAQVGADSPARGEELQQQILESLRPMLRDFQREVQENVQQVRQALTQPAQEGWPALATAGEQESLPPGEQTTEDNKPQGAQSPLQQAVQQTLQALRQTIAWLVETLRALLQTLRYLLQAVASLLKTLMVALQQGLATAARPVTHALSVLLRIIVQALIVWLVQIFLRPVLRALVKWLQSLIRDAAVGQQHQQQAGGNSPHQGQPAPVATAS